MWKLHVNRNILQYYHIYIKTYITVVKKDMMNSMYEIISHTLKLIYTAQQYAFSKYIKN